MKYTEKEFMHSLGTEEIYESFLDNFEESMAEYEEKGAFFLVDGFVAELQQTWGFLNEKYDFVMRELRRVRENEIAARYSFLLYKMLLRNVGNPRIKLTGRPCFEDTALTVDFEMAAYFSLLAFAPDMIVCHKERGLSDKIITDTLEDCFEGTIKLRTVTHGRDGFDDLVYFAWNQRYINCNIIRIGILNFEMNHKFPAMAKVFKNRKGEYAILSLNCEIAKGGYIAGSAGYPDIAFVSEYSESNAEYIGYPADMQRAKVLCERTSLKKNEWQEVLSEGDGAVSVHIPTGIALTEENCLSAFCECFNVAKKYYPELNVKALYCSSWLLDPQIGDIINKRSNIVNFGGHFLRYPIKSEGRGVFSFLFRKPFKELSELPENTSLERAVKAHYLEGKYIYETAGVIFEDMLT